MTMALQLPRNAYRVLRLLAAFIAILFPIIAFTYKSCNRDGLNICSRNGRWKYEHDRTMLPSSSSLDFYSRPSGNLSVDLVMATVVGDDITWTENVRRVASGEWNLKQYFADDRKAMYHPPKNKGREVSMYFTYILDHYDKLPDITIFIHAHENPWHVEGQLLDSMTEALNLLDLEEVQRRGYAGLRVNWMNACPDWIRTDVTVIDEQKKEEPYMYRSFVENFSATNKSSDVEGGSVPPVLATPCCSQFGVTKATILRRKKEEYQRFLDNLLNTELTDYIYGRTWEHMWSFLFTGKAVDCPIEWKTMCTMYRVCFESQKQMQEFTELGWEQSNIREELSFWTDLRHPVESAAKRKRIEDARAKQLKLRDEALRRGLDESGEWRKGLGDIYED